MYPAFSLRRHPHVAIVVIAMLLAALFLSVERFGLLPLTGQTMPVYGALPTQATTTSKAASRVRNAHPASRKSLTKKPATQQRRAVRQSQR